MSIENLSSEDNKKLRYVIDEGVKTAQSIKDLRESFSDVIKSFAAEFQIEAKDLKLAIKAAIKENIEEEQATVTNAETLLQLAGRR